MARENKRALYLLGERLIQNRTPVAILTAVVTAWFGFHTAQLEMITSFGELLPNGHPFIEVHDEYAKDFGGANNITLMVEVEEGNLFNVETLGQIWTAFTASTTTRSTPSATALRATWRLPPAVPCVRSR